MICIGTVEVHQPRVCDQRPPCECEKFTLSILPPYLRKTKSMEELLPWLYLKGISTGNFGEALLGKNVKGLSASTITRLSPHGRRSARVGPSDPLPTSTTCTHGPTASTSTSVRETRATIVNVSWF